MYFYQISLLNFKSYADWCFWHNFWYFRTVTLVIFTNSVRSGAAVAIREKFFKTLEISLDNSIIITY